MRLKIETTITSYLDLDTMTTEHFTAVGVEESGVPTELIYATALGGCKATEKSIIAEYPRLAEAVRERPAEQEDPDAE
jgi:hypothetical protein